MRVNSFLQQRETELITASPAMTVKEAMSQMLENNIGCLPVVDAKNELVGMVTDRDIFRSVHDNCGNVEFLAVRDLMNSNVVVGLAGDDLDYIAGLMKRSGARYVPIVEGHKIVGIVSMSDIVRSRAKNAEMENRYLRLCTDGLDARDRSGD